MLFQFRLQSLEKIEPWGGEKPSLSWFGLTDGEHWWETGFQELFRYSPAIVEYWANEYPDHQEISPYVDYQIVRPWEDLLQCVPAILDPVPDDLIQRIQNMEKWQNLQDKAWAWVEERDDDAAWNLAYEALRWWSERSWDAGYLSHPPKIWLWTQGDTFHLRWDNRKVLHEGIPVWAATFGEITIPLAAFVEEVRSFDARLMTAMAERVAAVCSGALRPGIDINLDALVSEQQDRSIWLESALARTDGKSDWDKVRKALDEVERICYNNAVEGL